MGRAYINGFWESTNDEEWLPLRFHISYVGKKMGYTLWQPGKPQKELSEEQLIGIAVEKAQHLSNDHGDTIDLYLVYGKIDNRGWFWTDSNRKSKFIDTIKPIKLNAE